MKCAATKKWRFFEKKRERGVRERAYEKVRSLKISLSHASKRD